jgi:hypothetical protein
VKKQTQAKMSSLDLAVQEQQEMYQLRERTISVKINEEPTYFEPLTPGEMELVTRKIFRKEIKP